MDLREFDHRQIRLPRPQAHSAGEYRLEIVLSVESARQLWSCAFNKALSQTALTYADIQELIGSRDDPSVQACLALVAEPVHIPGCSLDEFRVIAPDESVVP